MDRQPRPLLPVASYGILAQDFLIQNSMIEYGVKILDLIFNEGPSACKYTKSLGW